MPRFETFRFKDASTDDTSSWEKDMELGEVLAKVDRGVDVEAQFDAIKPVVYTVGDLRKTFRTDNE